MLGLEHLGLEPQRDKITFLVIGDRTVAEGIAFCLAPRNKAAVIATIMKRLKLNDPVSAEEGYLDVINGGERKLLPVMDGLRNIQRLMKLRNPAIEKLKMEELVDDRILRRLDESGFIDNLAKTYPAK